MIVHKGPFMTHDQTGADPVSLKAVCLQLTPLTP